MSIYPVEKIKLAQQLRALGQTYSEINEKLGIKIPKSTLSYWCKNIDLPCTYKEKVIEINGNNLKMARQKALLINSAKRSKYLRELDKANFYLSKKISSHEVSKIALAMLCLGEASKSGSSSSFYFGNSNSNIIAIFLALLKKHPNFDSSKIRCTVQCRADQNTGILEKYWKTIVGLPGVKFYKPQVDQRTKGKPTLRSSYKGVLRIDYLDNSVRLELESLSKLIYNNLINKGL